MMSMKIYKLPWPSLRQKESQLPIRYRSPMGPHLLPFIAFVHLISAMALKKAKVLCPTVANIVARLKYDQSIVIVIKTLWISSKCYCVRTQMGKG